MRGGVVSYRDVDSELARLVHLAGGDERQRLLDWTAADANRTAFARFDCFQVPKRRRSLFARGLDEGWRFEGAYTLRQLPGVGLVGLELNARYVKVPAEATVVHLAAVFCGLSLVLDPDSNHRYLERIEVDPEARVVKASFGS